MHITCVDRFLTLFAKLQGLALVKHARSQRGPVERERTHLLLLYPPLCSCIASPDGRVRDMLQDILLQAGAELGFPPAPRLAQADML